MKVGQKVQIKPDVMSNLPEILEYAGKEGKVEELIERPNMVKLEGIPYRWFPDDLILLEEKAS
jgi:hypothetical protein